MSSTTPDNNEPPINKRTIVYFATAGIIAAIGLLLSLWLSITDPPVPDTTGPACERTEATGSFLAGPIQTEGFIDVDGAPIPDTIHGPDRTGDNGEPICYEHSPAGASIAAASYASLGANGHNRLLIEELAVDSPTRDRALEATPERNPAYTVRTPAVPVATKIEDYTGDTATVVIVFSVDGQYHAGPFDLVWDEGDWKWDIPTGRPITYSVPHLGGYNAITEEN